ncbi:MAG: hypothetical protein MUC97_09440 [Bernardetiaceae bacterium]|nr:hypothetical protein [Bernardetiaceae bacterium]
MANPGLASDTLTLAAAKETGRLKLSIRGSYNPANPQPGVFSHIGECMDARMKNETDSNLVVKVTSGTWLMARDTNAQNMLVTKTSVFTIPPGKRLQAKITALCGEMNKDAPDVYVQYEVGPSAGSDLLALARTIEATGAQTKAGQYALWAVTDFATKKELGEDEPLLRSSQQLLDLARLKVNIFGKPEPVLVAKAGKTAKPTAKVDLSPTKIDQASAVAAPATDFEPAEVMANAEEAALPAIMAGPQADVPAEQREAEHNGWLYLMGFGLTVVSAYWLTRKKRSPQDRDSA